MPVSAPFIDEVFLSVNDNNISFTFSALNYAVENTDLYEYCLEEYDKEWKTLMKGNQVSYTELLLAIICLGSGRFQSCSNKSGKGGCCRKYAFYKMDCGVKCSRLLYSYLFLLRVIGEVSHNEGIYK